METALISLIHPPLNSTKAPGPSGSRFRPLGIPEAFAERLGEPRLTAQDFKALGGGKACPLLFVIISSKDFEGEDTRPGYSLDKPLSDSDLLARMDRWWQIGRHVAAWKITPQNSPRILVAVSGTPQHRVIVAAVKINRRGWRAAQPEPNQLYQIPTVATPNLDAYKLRGRLLSPDINIKFGGITSQFFVILGCDGRTSGGQS